MREVIRKAVTRAVIAFSLIAAALMLYAGTADPIVVPGVEDNYGRPNAVGSPAYFVDKYDCWTGEAPKGATARRAVITDAGVTRIVKGAKFEQAIADVFGEPTEIETVHGFCP